MSFAKFSLSMIICIVFELKIVLYQLSCSHSARIVSHSNAQNSLCCTGSKRNCKCPFSYDCFHFLYYFSYLDDYYVYVARDCLTTELGDQFVEDDFVVSPSLTLSPTIILWTQIFHYAYIALHWPAIYRQWCGKLCLFLVEPDWGTK